MSNLLVRQNKLRKTATFVVGLLILMTGDAWAGALGGSLGLKTSTHFGRTYGHTLYHLNASGYDEDAETVLRVDSELEFPLDFYVAGAELTLSGRSSTGLPWSVSAYLSTSLSEPSGSVKDSDWLSAPLLGQKQLFSYTESDVEGSALLIDLSGDLTFLTRPSLSLFARAGFAYQKYTFDVFGVEGWQLDAVGNKVWFSLYDGELVGAYEVSYKMPYLELSADLVPAAAVKLTARVGGSPRVMADDLDNHVLRFKTGDGDCSGEAYWTRGAIDWVILHTRDGRRLSVGLAAEYRKIDTDGSQVQQWYGDDPASPGDDDTGGVVAGIPYKIESEQAGIRLLVNWWM